LLYDRAQVQRLLWPTFWIAGFARFETAVQRWATVAHLVLPFVGAVLWRCGNCVWRNGLIVSFIVIERLSRAA
jgi:hypothetical protein